MTTVEIAVLLVGAIFCICMAAAVVVVWLRVFGHMKRTSSQRAQSRRRRARDVTDTGRGRTHPGAGTHASAPMPGSGRRPSPIHPSPRPRDVSSPLGRETFGGPSPGDRVRPAQVAEPATLPDTQSAGSEQPSELAEKIVYRHPEALQAEGGDSEGANLGHHTVAEMHSATHRTKTISTTTRDWTRRRTWRQAVTALAALADWLEREGVPTGLVEDAVTWEAFLGRLWPALRGAWSAQTQEEIRSATRVIVRLMKRHHVYGTLEAWLPTVSPAGSMLFSYSADLGDTRGVTPLRSRHLAAIRATLRSMIAQVESGELGTAERGQEPEQAKELEVGQGREKVEETGEPGEREGFEQAEEGEELEQAGAPEEVEEIGEPGEREEPEQAKELEVGQGREEVEEADQPGESEEPEQPEEGEELEQAGAPEEVEETGEPGEREEPGQAGEGEAPEQAGEGEEPEQTEQGVQFEQAGVLGIGQDRAEVEEGGVPEERRRIALSLRLLQARFASGGIRRVASKRRGNRMMRALRMAFSNLFARPARMIRTLRMAFSNLLARPSRTLLTMFGIILGVSVIIAVSITNESTIASLNDVFGEVSGNSDLMIMSSTADEEGFPEEARRRLVGVPGIAVAAPSVHGLAVLAGETPERELQAGILGDVEHRLTLYGVDPRLDPDVRVYRMVEGEWLANDLDLYEVVLVKDFADDEEIEVGDDVPIITPNGIELIRVIGLISKEGAGQFNNGLFGAMPLGAVQKLFNRAGDLDQIDIVVADEVRTTQGLAMVQDVIKEKLGERYSVTFPASQGERVSQMLDIYQMGISMFGIIAVFVGAFLIYNAFSMTVVERTREIGMLRTIGMTRGQITRQVLLEAIILGVSGSALGIGGGVLLAGGLIRVMAAMLASAVPDTTIPTDGLVNGATVGVIVTIFAALIPARHAGSVSPLEALRIRSQHKESWVVRRGWILGAVMVGVSLPAYLLLDVPPEMQFQVMNLSILGIFTGATLLTPLTVGPWERVVRPFVRAVFGGEGRLGGGNIRRSRMRTTMTVTALMVGVAMLLSIRAMSASFQSDLGEWIDGYLGGDLYVYSSMPMQLEFGARLEAMEGVQAAAPSRYLDVTVKKPNGSNEILAMNVVDPAKHDQVGAFTFTETMGDEAQSMARLAQGDAIFLSTLIAGRYELGVGDKLTVQTRRGLRDFEVAGVVVDFYDNGMVIEGSWRDMRQYFRVDDVSAFQVVVEPGCDPQETMDEIERIHGTRRNLVIFSNEALKEMAMGISGQTRGLFGVMSWIALIVASLGVVNTLLMNVMERTREIGMLRGMGMTRWQVVKMILAEAAVMGTIGGALGIGVGMLLARVFVVLANTMQGYNLAYHVPSEALGFAIIVSLGVSQVAALWPSARAARLRVIEAIQYE